MEKFGLMAKERIHSSDTGRNWEDRVRMRLVIRNRAPRDSYTGLKVRASLSSEPAQLSSRVYLPVPATALGYMAAKMKQS